MAARGRNLQFGLLGLLAVVILGGLSAYAARDNIIRYTLNPNRNFGEGAQATAPNYALRSAWAAQPSVAAKSVDVFFIYPTVYFSSEYWNAPIKNASVRERLTRIIRPLYVAPFSSAANLYMPLYRQAAPYSFMGSSEDGRSARELAFDDVSKAFRLFLDQLNDGRPFIVAGYGQGALYSGSFRNSTHLSAIGCLRGICWKLPSPLSLQDQWQRQLRFAILQTRLAASLFGIPPHNTRVETYHGRTRLCGDPEAAGTPPVAASWPVSTR